MEAAKLSAMSGLLSVFCEIVKTQKKMKYFCRDYQRERDDDCIQVKRVAKAFALVGIVQTTMNDGITKKNVQCVYTDGNEMIKRDARIGSVRQIPTVSGLLLLRRMQNTRIRSYKGK